MISASLSASAATRGGGLAGFLREFFGTADEANTGMDNGTYLKYALQFFFNSPKNVHEV